jgi:hypothetical protein
MGNTARSRIFTIIVNDAFIAGARVFITDWCIRELFKALVITGAIRFTGIGIAEWFSRVVAISKIDTFHTLIFEANRSRILTISLRYNAFITGTCVLITNRSSRILRQTLGITCAEGRANIISVTEGCGPITVVILIALYTEAPHTSLIRRIDGSALFTSGTTFAGTQLSIADRGSRIVAIS